MVSDRRPASETPALNSEQALAWQLAFVCRQEGAEAWRRGLKKTDNPYAQDQEVEHFGWADGWFGENFKAPWAP